MIIEREIMGSRGLVPLRGRSEEGAEGVRHPCRKPPSFFSSFVIATYTLLLSKRQTRCLIWA